MHDPTSPLASLGLVGGRLCLDFANTVGWRGGEKREYLNGYADLVVWSRRAETIDAAEAATLLDRAEAEPEAARRILRRAIELREAIYGIVSSLAAGREVDEAELAIINREVAAAMASARLERAGEGFAWGWHGAGELERVVWPIARSTAELLTSAELARVGECAGERCGWLYLDTSKNRSRRWCDMRDCGNRAKVRRHYHRVREEGAAAT